MKKQETEVNYRILINCNWIKKLDENLQGSDCATENFALTRNILPRIAPKRRKNFLAQNIKKREQYCSLKIHEKVSLKLLTKSVNCW